jgi:catechol 2,3-dioxygenase-like lactoylglutathione lyase family enzyme
VIRGIDNVGIAVRDLEASLKFYHALGFREEWRDERSALVRAGSAALYLFRTSNQTALQRSFDLLGNPAGIDHLSLAVEDVDAAYKALEAQGIKFERPPQDYDWGRAACLYDPDGNCIWLLQREAVSNS